MDITVNTSIKPHIMYIKYAGEIWPCDKVNHCTAQIMVFSRLDCDGVNNAVVTARTLHSNLEDECRDIMQKEKSKSSAFHVQIHCLWSDVKSEHSSIFNMTISKSSKFTSQHCSPSTSTLIFYLQKSENITKNYTSFADIGHHGRWATRWAKSEWCFGNGRRQKIRIQNEN